MSYTTPLALIFGIAAALLGPSHAFAVNQQEAMIQAEILNRSASDASMQNSTTSAMRALMDLNSHNQTGAMNNGYQAYGQYRNSENMDILRLRNAISIVKMDSGMSTLPQKSAWTPPPVTEFDTSFKRLDPAFLRQGEAGKVADEFERKSGMKREDFLRHMARASDRPIHSDDPQLVDKVLSRLEGFVKEIPNAEFRGNIQKEIARVPQSARTGLIAKAMSKAASMLASNNSSREPAPTITSESSGAAFTGEVAAPVIAVAEAAPAPAPTEAAPAPETDRGLASGAVSVIDSNFRGVENEKWAHGDALGSVLQTALDEQKEDSIFKQVSKRYRILSPKLSLNGDKVNVPEAK